MDEAAFKERTMRLGLNAIELSRHVSRDIANDVLIRQLIRSATSVGANYRAACRARSDAEMLAKLAIIEEVADETIFWLEAMTRAKAIPEAATAPLMREADEILRMTVASSRTIRARVAAGNARTQVPASQAGTRDNNPKSEVRNPK